MSFIGGIATPLTTKLVSGTKLFLVQILETMDGRKEVHLAPRLVEMDMPNKHRLESGLGLVQETHTVLPCKPQRFSFTVEKIAVSTCGSCIRTKFNGSGMKQIVRGNKALFLEINL